MNNKLSKCIGIKCKTSYVYHKYQYHCLLGEDLRQENKDSCFVIHLMLIVNKMDILQVDHK